jgi:cell division control protein 6
MTDGSDGSDMLSWDESLFRDERVFEVDYLPETFKHRETQMESLKYALKPAVRGSRPLNVMAQGPPGTGKTTAVHILFDELRAQTDVQAVRVNCQVNATRYAVFSRLFEGVFDYEPPASGISFKKLFSQVTDRLVENDEVLVVALDDINYLFYESAASDTLYSLLRAHEEQGGARIGVIVVSSDLDLNIIEELDGRVQSVFRPEDVYFPKYDEPAIADILRERVDRGFHEGVVDSQVLDRVAELTADQGGDLRVGIDLLRRAGLNAEMRASQRVEPLDVEEAFETSRYVHLSRRLGGLSDSESALLEVIANNEGEQAGDIYEAFHEQTDLGYTRYAEIINKLDQLGIVDTRYADVDGRGRSRELSLEYDAEAVLERL